MAKFPLTTLKVVVAVPKRTRTTSGPKRESNKIIYGTVIETEDGKFKVSVDKDKNGNTEEILDFTPNSFNVKGRTTVFTRKKNDKGTRIRIIKDIWKAKFHPGSPERYIPFDKNWIVKGYIIRDGIIRLFDFKELVGIEGYMIDALHDEDNQML